MRLSPRIGYPAFRRPGAGRADDVANTRAEAQRMAVILRQAGINWNLAPVVDVAVNPKNPAVVAPGGASRRIPPR